MLGPVKIDHLIADVYGASASAFIDLEAEAPVERQRRLNILHRQRHVVEARDGGSPLRVSRFA